MKPRSAFTLTELWTAASSRRFRYDESGENSPHSKSAFTLIELLVVVAIIVVLLALLVPAMDKALYQAELAVCGTNVRSAASGVTVYAFDHKRRYPYRTLVHDYDGGVVVTPERLTMASNPGNPGSSWDDRTMLREYLSVKGSLQCPLNGDLDLEEDAAFDTFVNSSYTLWYGWQFRHGGDNPIDGTAARERGMFRVGDRWSWTTDSSPPHVERFSALVSDYLGVNDSGGGRSTHPDKRGVWSQFGPYQRAPNPFGPEGSQAMPGWGETWGFATFAWWNGVGNRGGVDLNFATADGAVRRYDDVSTQPERSGLSRVPSTMDDRPNQPLRFAVAPN